VNNLCLKAIILVTRQVLFSAVRHTVASTFVSHSSAKLKQPDERLLEVCIRSANQNLQLLHRLFEIVAVENAGFGMIDYHHAFNAAIIMELAALYKANDPTAKPTDGTDHFQFVTDTLSSAGRLQNEFARDCSVVLSDFRQLIRKLMLEMDRTPAPPPTSVPEPYAQTVPVSQMPVLSPYVQLSPVDPAFVANFPFTNEAMVDEFMGWLQYGGVSE
jgi:hypothetical protein